MTIKKQDVQKALTQIGNNLPNEGAEGTDVNKAGPDAPTPKGTEIPEKENMNSANGAAEGGGDGSMEAPGEEMNSKYGNKKGSAPKEGTRKKSEFPADFSDNLPPEVETKVEVSDFLKSLVDHTADQVNGLRDFVIKSDEASDARTDDILDAIEEIQKSQANTGIVLQAICEKIGVIENAPATVAKSQQPTQQPQQPVQQQPVDRQFANMQNASEASNQNATGFYKSLSGKQPHEIKKAISSALCELVRKGELSDTEVINFETYNHVSPEADTKLRSMFQ